MYSSWDLNIIEKDGVVNMTLIHHSVPPPEVRAATFQNIGMELSEALERANSAMRYFTSKGRNKFTLEKREFKFG